MKINKLHTLYTVQILKLHGLLTRSYTLRQLTPEDSPGTLSTVSKGWFWLSSLTHANQKYRRNLVAYNFNFWHHYRTNFVQNKLLFPIFWTKLLAPIVNARLPRDKVAKLRAHYKIMSLKVKFLWFSRYGLLAYSRIQTGASKDVSWKMFDKWLVLHTVTMHIHNKCLKSEYIPCVESELRIVCVRRRNCGTWSKSSCVETELQNAR